MVSFNEIPTNLRVPFVAAEIDGSRASQGPALLAYRALLMGQRIAGAGTAAANSVHKVTSADQVAGLAGRGSMLHRQALAWFAANKSTECHVLVLEDDGAGVAASGTVTISGSPTAAGTFALYLGGQRVAVAVTTSDTPTTIAAALATAIGTVSGTKDYPVKASANLGVLTLTAHHKGAVGNEIDVRVNYRDGEATPAGLTVAIVAMASGATNPTLTSGIAALGDSWFNVIAHPFTDATSLSAIETELASRFGPMRMIDGVAITAKAASYGTVAALGAARNSKHSVIVRTDSSPTPPDEYAAHVAGVVAYYSQIDPARPLQTLPLPWVKAPAEADRDTLQERNLLLYSGISTARVAAGDVVQIERLITTYQTNPAGTADTAFLSLETMLTLMYLRFSFRARISSRYPRHKLANDGARFASGQAVITPKLGKAEAIAWFREMEALGLVEGFDQFKADLVVERNTSDPTRLDFLLPADLINQLIVTAAQVQFLL